MSAKRGISVAPSRLLEALFEAFAYPAEGIDKTLAGLRGALACGLLDKKTEERAGKVLGTAGCFADDTAAQLAYTRLFIGSLKMEAPPYASYYLEEGLLNGRTAAEVEAVYRQFGLGLKDNLRVPADHISYLLAFLSFLARRFEETGEAVFAEAYADFNEAYVLSWIDCFTSLVYENSEEPYYPELVSLTSAALGGERACTHVSPSSRANYC